MVFTSKEFLVFFLVCAVAFFLLAPRARWVLLLGASYVFYAAGEPRHLPLLIGISLSAWLGGLLLERMREGPVRTAVLTALLLALLMPLFLYKYLAFALASAAPFIGSTARPDALGFDVMLPLGISFFTFQAIGYVADVYRGHDRAERNPGKLALFIAFFPQLIAGPIERAGRLLPQFALDTRFDPERATSGARLILWGLFKKLVIADNLSRYVDAVYAEPTSFTGLPLILGTVFFAFQIYCDFSAYVDIARGTARILGIELMRNFNRPYGARSINEFWHRWHISLTSWFRDYVYVPLGGNRHGEAAMYRNIAIVFVLSGLWHGASWTFVIWGALHGAALILLRATTSGRARLAHVMGLDRRRNLRDALAVTATFAFVCFAWIFFRAATLADAWHVATNLFSGLAAPEAALSAVGGMIEAANGTALGFAALLATVAAFLASHVVSVEEQFDRLINQPVWLRWGAYYAMVLGVLFLSGDSDAFIYFRF